MHDSSLDPNGYDWFVTIAIGLCMTIIVIIFIDLIKSFYCRQQKLANNIKYLSLITLLFYFIMCISILIGFINILLTYHQAESGFSYITTRLGIFSWMLGLYLMLITYGIRIHHTFRNSFLKLSSNVVRALYFFTISLGVSGVGLVTVILLKMYYIRDYIVIYMVLNYTIVSIMLMILFIKRIDRIMLGKFMDQSIVDDNMIQTIIDNDLIDLFVNNALLTSLSIISTFIGAFGSIIIPKLDDTDQRYPIFGYFIVVITATINVISIYLLFKFNKSKYSTLCYYAHSLCKRCKVQLIIKMHKFKNNEQKIKFSRSVLSVNMVPQMPMDSMDRVRTNETDVMQNDRPLPVTFVPSKTAIQK